MQCHTPGTVKDGDAAANVGTSVALDTQDSRKAGRSWPCLAPRLSGDPAAKQQHPRIRPHQPPQGEAKQLEEASGALPSASETGGLPRGKGKPFPPPTGPCSHIHSLV